MGLVCLIDLQHKGKSYKKGEAIAVDPAKVSVFISKGWAKESGDAVADIDVEVKEIKAKRQTKEFKIDIDTKSDATDQD